LEANDAQFKTLEKVHAMTLIMKLSSLKLITVRGVCVHIVKMNDIATQLQNFEVDISESFFVYYILNTLPQHKHISKSLIADIRISCQLMNS